MPDGGLITPVLKSADTTDIYTMSRDWADLVRCGRLLGPWLGCFRVMQLAASDAGAGAAEAWGDGRVQARQQQQQPRAGGSLRHSGISCDAVVC